MINSLSQEFEFMSSVFEYAQPFLSKLFVVIDKLFNPKSLVISNS